MTTEEQDLEPAFPTVLHSQGQRGKKKKKKKKKNILPNYLT